MTAATSWTESESRVYRANREHLVKQLSLVVRHATLAVERALECLQKLTDLDGPQDPERVFALQDVSKLLSRMNSDGTTASGSAQPTVAPATRLRHR